MVFLQDYPVLSTVILQDFPVVKDRIVLYLILDNPMILSFFAGKSCVVLQDVPGLLTLFPITLHTVWSAALHQKGPLWNTLLAEPVHYSIHTNLALCDWHTDRMIYDYTPYPSRSTT